MTTLLPSKDRLILTASTKEDRSSSKVGKCYRADRQIKYLHLKAEVDLLWQKLQTLKQQKQDSERAFSAETHK